VRGHVENLASPQPVFGLLPAVFQDNDTLIKSWCAGLDGVLAPIIATLDCLPDYFNPATTPDDVLGWLATWIGLRLVDREPRQRELVAAGVNMLRWRGTVRGVHDAIKALLDVDVEISESGGSKWSTSPGSPLPGRPEARILVRLDVNDTAAVDVRQLDDLIASIKPVHVAHEIERIHNAPGS
jgi:phage tail-like protein